MPPQQTSQHEVNGILRVADMEAAPPANEFTHPSSPTRVHQSPASLMLIEEFPVVVRV